MKGVIIAEMVRWIEQAFSPAIADAVIVRSNLPGDGVYTTVGNYPHTDALAMLGALSEISSKPVAVLADSYGFWLASRFMEIYPEMFEGYTDAVTFLRDVDGQHHREVTKLYPDARTPSIVVVIDGEELTVSYGSHRPLADVAHGLVRGYIDYFGDDLEVVRDQGSPGPHAARFLVRKPAPQSSG
ncbi:guanylate cyclase [Novosphingobium sediminis]|uniref:Guanylate cyclase n=1 Tax=Novosphingobium sediminis TaxID=707214 RepID=A0A512ALV4_9SPHN|nr:heme NO-binding domain-containing protein [Novosphingobium sediminis]GEO00685.1 guanylate cyclase [Novosphingobium sediminis]